ncbi:conserved hypothetical protein [Hyella patelloides LEGE 07179]|uniref:Uncharacterized protein n=1 Tax=Hyella patelloides LEGE 07179 TaxID=945734 RepID=A0A563VRV3_9CYAN|nr:hypothetical protein [Hyella patelloides]VEP14145.1 conserved hypothetical protein [Hyella patelloides LEGE 07179]
MKQFWQRHKIPLLMILFSLALGFAPLISVILAEVIAHIGNCTVHEGFVNPCQIGSFELGELLATMFVAGWYMLISLPLGFIGLLLGFLTLMSQIKKRNLSSTKQKLEKSKHS